MKQLEYIELFAGLQPNGQPAVQRISVKVLDDDSCELVRSPAFVKGIASGDLVKLNKEDQSFELIKRAGNLAIRVFARQDIRQLADDLTAQLEKLGAELDLETDRLLVYTIHVSCGFSAIENILDDLVGEETDSAWFYGNVYDPNDGVTPLNWWQEILEQK